MRSAELKGRCRSAAPGFGASPDIPHSAFRTPHLLAGAVTLVLLPLSAGAQQPDSTPKDTTSLPPVVVTGVRLPTVRELARGLAGRTATLDAQDLDARGVRTLADALEQLPGVTTSDELGATAEMDVSLRGFQVSPVIGVPQGVTVYVDGVRANEPDAHEVNFDLLPLEDVERVEVVYGPSVLLGRSAPRHVGLLRRRALRAGGRLARGYPQPDRHAVRQARAPERDVGCHPQLLGRRQPDLPGGQPSRERGGGESAPQLHRGRLLRSAGTPRGPQCPTPPRADAARDQRIRTLALERAVQRELRRGRLAPAEHDANRWRRRAA